MNDSAYYRLAMRIFADFGVTIAIPAVAAALFGKWLDDKYGTYPRYLIILLIIAFAMTGYIIYKKAKVYGKEYAKLTEKEKKEEKKD